MNEVILEDPIAKKRAYNAKYQREARLRKNLKGLTILLSDGEKKDFEEYLRFRQEQNSSLKMKDLIVEAVRLYADNKL